METLVIILLILLFIYLFYWNIKYGVCRRCGRTLLQEKLTIDDEYYEQIADYFDGMVVYFRCKDHKDCESHQKKNKK